MIFVPAPHAYNPYNWDKYTLPEWMNHHHYSLTQPTLDTNSYVNAYHRRSTRSPPKSKSLAPSLLCGFARVSALKSGCRLFWPTKKLFFFFFFLKNSLSISSWAVDLHDTVTSHVCRSPDADITLNARLRQPWNGVSINRPGFSFTAYISRRLVGKSHINRYQKLQEEEISFLEIYTLRGLLSRERLWKSHKDNHGHSFMRSSAPPPPRNHALCVIRPIILYQQKKNHSWEVHHPTPKKSCSESVLADWRDCLTIYIICMGVIDLIVNKLRFGLL